MQKTINSTMFRKMIIASAKILDDNKAFVDSLNVFPVPDGDTGTNMSLTYNNVVKELNNCLENDFAQMFPFGFSFCRRNINMPHGLQLFDCPLL